MENLPGDIVTNILSRVVPVKNILQIKCVCKLWHKLISHPKFANLHLKQSFPAGNNRIIVFAHATDSPSPIFLDYNEESECSVTHQLVVSKVDFPLSFDDCYLENCGSCYGLLCISLREELREEIVIWNPSIKQHRILPKDDDRGLCCFGYDSIHDDYKVVKASYEYGGGKVFSLKTNSWRRIEDTNYLYASHHSNNFLNGSLHWEARRNFHNPNLADQEDDNSTVYVAFSLAEERFLAEIPQPNADGGKSTEMNVLNGCLCFYRFDKNVGMDTGFEIWVMKEYMVRASWTKLCTVLWETIPPDFHAFSRPLCYSQDGDILLEIGLRGVVKYNMKEKKCVTAVFTLPGSDELVEKHAYFETLPYADSLISPHYDDA